MEKVIQLDAWRVSADFGTLPPWLEERLGVDVHTSGGFLPLTVGGMTANLGDMILRDRSGALWVANPEPPN